jgi:hypothetical protein
MARFNTSRTHGEEATRDLDRLLKTDALDYHAGHDPIGCQDIAWDIAGAIPTARQWTPAPQRPRLVA